MRKIFENVKLITKNSDSAGSMIIHHTALVGTYYKKFSQSLITVNKYQIIVCVFCYRTPQQILYYFTTSQVPYRTTTTLDPTAPLTSRCSQ